MGTNDTGKQNSFLLYCDLICFVDEMTDEEAGQLFKAILYHENGREIIEPASPIARGTLRHLLPHLDENRERYIAKCEKNRDNAIKRWQKKNANACDRIQAHANGMHTDTKTDTKTDTDTKTKTETDTPLPPNPLKGDEEQGEQFFSDYLLNDAFHLWLDYCKEHKRTVKGTQLDTLVGEINKQLKTSNEDAVIGVIKKSIAAGYKGIVWEWIKKDAPEQSDYDLAAWAEENTNNKKDYFSIGVNQNEN